jgi:5-methylcytosine-specific restriction endonuclease McrA
MDKRFKSGLRPRPKIGLGGVAPDAAASKLPPSPASRPSVMQAEETNHAEVHTTHKAMQVPSVIRLLTYRHIPQQSRALSRKNILLRDRNTCQFCGHALPASELTLDHVMPRSRGGRSSWENLVACCYGCNNRKGDRTPEEAGLKLQRRPRPFTLHTSRQLMRLIGHRDEKWRKYLFY